MKSFKQFIKEEKKELDESGEITVAELYKHLKDDHDNFKFAYDADNEVITITKKSEE